MHRNPTSNRGFSLVELSIVLVILGLLTGGILAGQNLIRAAEVRAVSNEAQRYQAAVHTFRDKYFSLPGDMTNATKFWGTMTNCGAGSPSGTGTETCDGNGDGQIDNNTGTAQTGERSMFWKHLANAGLIEGSYTGIAGTGRHDHTIAGENAPVSKIGSTAVWDTNYSSTAGASIFQFTLKSSANVLRVGGQSNNWNAGAILTIEETWNLDTKMDDGKATDGKVWAVRWNDCTPATSGTDYQDYDFGVTGKQCGIMFLNPY